MEHTKQPPEGFRIVEETDSRVLLEYKPPTIGCMGIFLGFWLIGWTFGCFFLLYVLYECLVTKLPVT